MVHFGCSVLNPAHRPAPVNQSGLCKHTCAALIIIVWVIDVATAFRPIGLKDGECWAASNGDEEGLP